MNVFINTNADYSGNNLGQISLVDETGYDTDGLLYANAAGIIPQDKRLANDSFFKGLKSAGIWSGITHMWGMYGSDFTHASVNMKTPSTNKLVAGTPAPVVSSGLDFSSVAALVKTGIILNSSDEVNLYLGVFNSTAEDTTAIRVMLGATSDGGDPIFLAKSSATGGTQAVIAGRTIAPITPQNNGVGYMAVSRVGTTVKAYDKGVLKNTITDSSTAIGATELGVGTYLKLGNTVNASTKTKINFVVKATALTDAQHATLNGLIVGWLFAMGLISSTVRDASL